MRGYGQTDRPEAIDEIHAPSSRRRHGRRRRRARRGRAVIVGHDWGAPVAWQRRSAAAGSVPRRRRPERAVSCREARLPDQRDAADRDGAVLSALFPAAGSRGGGARTQSARRRFAACSIQPQATSRASRTVALGDTAPGMVPRSGGFLTRIDRPVRASAVADRGRRRLLRRRIRADRAFAAPSTGIATSTATGSSWRPSTASGSRSPRSMSRATGTS